LIIGIYDILLTPLTTSLMTEVLLKLVEQLNSSVFMLFLILIVTGITVYKLGYWKNKFDTHDKRVEKIEGLAEKVTALTVKVDLIYQNTNPNAPLRAHSPVSLTPIGNEISKNIDADKIFKKYSNKLMGEVEKKSPNNAYDIQQSSILVAKSIMINMLEEVELVKIKQEAFDRGLLTEDIMSVFGVLLRNEILKHKGISLAEVDKNSPKEN